MSTNNTIDNLLNLFNINDLFRFLKEYSAKHPSFRKELDVFLKKSCLGPDVSKVSDLRQDVLEAFDEAVMDGRYGEWLNLRELNRNLGEVVEEAYNLMELGNSEPALATGIQILATLGEDFEEYQPDDSYGYAGDIYNNATELFIDAAKHPNTSRKMLDKYYVELDESKDIDRLYPYGFDSKDHLLLRLALICRTSEERLPILDKMIKACKSDYELSTFVAQKIADLTTLKRDQEAENTIRYYINLPEICGIAIDRALTRGDFDEALHLVDDGIMVARNDSHRGTERDWMKRRLSIFEIMDDTDKQIEAAKDLFLFEYFDKEYYTKLKSLVPSAQWKDFILAIIDEAMPNFKRDIDGLAAILIAEQEWERLYKLVVRGKQTQIHQLDKYATYLKANHSAELLQIYDEKLRWFASQGTGRDRYESIVYSMRVMLKLDGGYESVRALVDYFRQTYKNRRVMMEMINKL